MDVRTFTEDLLRAFADRGIFEQVALRTEGPVADGYARVYRGLFLRFYFNEATGTIAFALVEGERRVWGIDYDNRRGWHLHPVDDPGSHVEIAPLSVIEIVDCLQDVLSKRGPKK
jgi:hypothetical protein